ncbi:sigma-B regulation protein RsbU (phosphoserine phosphatase) [Selenomonas ruminantium]|uniref:Sigma-B regulation protein RsbU (Phosphoserine phosphatase) n=1 Tax=Selenomonas ruminantium TaxID=971 RepID=A0A1M6S8M6_SELRU|nr:SpoIIE family protein phosphatase [Selenomonas ruminantium]SHK41050.1 sigma-B regulation protein RsbU (phosphoserine phosphatase) [Selenomonas ruminantium]
MVKMGIKKQALTLLLLCSLVTLLLVGGISLYGMVNIRNSAVQIGQSIGQSAAENSSEILREDLKGDLMRMLANRGKQIELIFANLSQNVTMLSREMTAIRQHPEDYTVRHVSEPDRAQAGQLAAQLQYAPDVAKGSAALQREIGLTANLQDWLFQMNASQPAVASAYVASGSGFGITVDDRSDKKFKAGENVPFAIDFRTRPWYQDAASQKKLVFSRVFNDLYSGNLGITCAAPYFDEAGEVAGVVGMGMFLTQVSDVIEGTRLGETGYGFLMGQKGRIIFSGKEDGVLKAAGPEGQSLFDVEDESLARIARQMAAGENGISEVMIDGVPCYLAYAPVKEMNASYGIVMAAEEVNRPVQANVEVIEQTTSDFIGVLNQSIQQTLLAVLALAALFLMAVPLVSSRVAERFVSPIHELADGVREIASGNLEKKLSINTGNEIEHLAVCFNAMTDELQNQMKNLAQVTADKERISTELSVATNIQESMLPRIFPPFPEKKEFDIYASMHPAKEVGGDFYDFYMLDENHVMLTIADVSGKGVPAALFMVIAKTILKNFALTMSGSKDLAPLVSCTNDQLCQNNDAMMFVTAFVGLLNIKTGHFTYVNAGHNPPLIYRKKENKFSYMDVKRNFVLGGMDELMFKGQDLTLEPGDKLFLYTDGVTEALNESDELYGEERLIDTLDAAGADKVNLQELLAMVQKSLALHVGTAAQSDDITMLALSYYGDMAKEGDDV